MTDIEDGIKPESTGGHVVENRELRKRIRLLKQENEVLRRAAAHLSQANLPGKALPARERTRHRKDFGGGDVPGTEVRSTAVLPLALRSCDQFGVRRGLPSQRTLRRPSRRPEFGYRLLTFEARGAGHPMTDRTAWRICSNNGW